MLPSQESGNWPGRTGKRSKRRINMNKINIAKIHGGRVDYIGDVVIPNEVTVIWRQRGNPSHGWISRTRGVSLPEQKAKATKWASVFNRPISFGTAMFSAWAMPDGTLSRTAPRVA